MKIFMPTAVAKIPMATETIVIDQDPSILHHSGFGFSSRCSLSGGVFGFGLGSAFGAGRCAGFSAGGGLTGFCVSRFAAGGCAAGLAAGGCAAGSDG